MTQLPTYSLKEIDSSKIEKFAAQLRGKIVMPSDDNYDEARKVFNAMIDKRPRMFARNAPATRAGQELRLTVSGQPVPRIGITTAHRGL
jgi:hypothetical protein